MNPDVNHYFKWVYDMMQLTLFFSKNKPIFKLDLHLFTIVYLNYTRNQNNHLDTGNLVTSNAG